MSDFISIKDILAMKIVLVDISTVGEVKKTSSVETYLHTLYKYTNYSIRVLAYTGAGDGVLSPPIFCTTEEDGKNDIYYIIIFIDPIYINTVIYYYCNVNVF